MADRSTKLSIAALLLSGSSLVYNFLDCQQRQQQEMVQSAQFPVDQAEIVADTNDDGYTSPEEWSKVYQACELPYDSIKSNPRLDFVSPGSQRDLTIYLKDAIIARVFPPGYFDNRKFHPAD